MIQIDDTKVEVLESMPIRIRYKNITWVPEKKKKGQHDNRHPKINYFTKWVGEKEVGDVFTMDDFYKDFPKHEGDTNSQKRLEKAISDLIAEGKIDQWIKPGEFKVIS